MPPTQPHIAILIVGYNSRKDLDDCLGSIAESSYQNLSVYFLQNGPEDGSLNYTKEHFPEVIAEISPSNLGYAGGNNLLIEKALSSQADAIFLLNPDTVIDKDCLASLVAAYQPDEVLQPLVLLHEKGKKTSLVNTWGNPLHYLGISYAGGNRQPEPDGKGAEIAIASGAAMLIPRQVLEAAGPFDPSFFMYHEDVDLSWRCRMLGFSIRSLYAAKVWHKYEYSKNKKKFFFIERNRLLFMIKNYQAKTLALVFIPFIINELLTLLFSLKGGWTFYKIRSYGSVIVMMPQALKKRRQIQRLRLVSDKELAPFLTAALDFSEANIPGLSLYGSLLSAYWKIASKLI